MKHVQSINLWYKKEILCHRPAMTKNFTLSPLPNLQSIWMAKLVNKPLGPFCLFHDAFLVVLTDRPAKLVVVHGWAILPLTPKTSNSYRIFDFEDSFGSVEPPYATAVQMGLAKEFLQELPQVDVWVGTRATGAPNASSTTFGIAVFITDFIYERKDKKKNVKLTTKIRHWMEFMMWPNYWYFNGKLFLSYNNGYHRYQRLLSWFEL